jgi:hypothetical protein
MIRPTMIVLVVCAGLETSACDDGADLGLDGEWMVTTWTVTRAIGANMPNPEASGGVSEPRCGELARMNYRATQLSIDRATAAVRVNGMACEAAFTADTVTARCGCSGGGGFVVCSATLTLRLDGSRLRGEERVDFNNPPGSPAYCAVTATFEATRR